MSVCPVQLPPGSRLVVFGGSFNPPHVAHLAVAEAAVHELKAQLVLWMPAATSPHKQGEPSNIPAAHRMAMVEEAIEDNERFVLSDWEMNRGDVSFTVDTLQALTSEQADIEIFLLMGGDSLAQFHRWKEPEAILSMARIAVYPRPGDMLESISEELLSHVHVIDAPGIDLSSTELRDRVQKGKSIRYLVPDAVLSYIKSHGLY